MLNIPARLVRAQQSLVQKILTLDLSIALLNSSNNGEAWLSHRTCRTRPGLVPGLVGENVELVALFKEIKSSFFYLTSRTSSTFFQQVLGQVLDEFYKSYEWC